MKVGCNYLLETEELVQNKQIQIDYFKFPALGFQMERMEKRRAFAKFCRNIKKQKPILLHGLYPAPHDLASPTLQKDFDKGLCDQLLQATGTPGISLHPCLFPMENGAPLKIQLQTILSNIRFMQETYPDLDFISVENVDSPRYGALIDPDVFSTIIRESGCPFLLDISHAYCAADARGEDVRAYLKRLPLEKVYEIHLNGWIRKGSEIMCHTKIQEEGYALFKEVLTCCDPRIITIEYGRSNDKLHAGIPVVQPRTVNEAVKREIIEQVEKIHMIIDHMETGLL